MTLTNWINNPGTWYWIA